MRTLLTACLLACLLPAFAPAGEPCAPGLTEGQRPGPYSFLVSVGEKRGTSHCYICDTEDRPACVVFARSLGDPLGRLVRGLDAALADHKAAEFRAWLTVLHADQPALDPKLVAWAKDQSVRAVPLGVFEDPKGPPAYRLHPDADVTVLLFVKQKVVKSYAFRAGELTDARVKEVLRDVPDVVGRAKK